MPAAPDRTPGRVARALDRLYDAAGVLAALCILFICGVVTAQVALNALARLGGPGLSFTIPGYADLSGYALAAASFLALAHTLRRGAHIRVTLLADRLPAPLRRPVDLLVLALASGLAGYASYWLWMLVAESLRYGDLSPGMIAVPLWVPQIPVAAGLTLLTVALVHTLAERARGAPIPTSGDEA